MSETSVMERYQFILDEGTNRKIDRIAEHLSQEMGMVRVSRSEAIRIIVGRFLLPTRSVESPTSPDTIN